MVAPADFEVDEHDVALHGAWPAVPSASPGPTVIARTDEDFINGLLDDLKAENSGARIGALRPQSPAASKTVRLFQPVHRVFNLVLLEAHCDVFQIPRLDPSKIDSAGLVVRRVAQQPDGGASRRNAKGETAYEGWLANRSQVTGWILLADEDADPDPARRPATLLTNNSQFDQAFRGGPPTVAEAATSLFIPGPDVAQATGRTILYGVLPLTSDSRGGEVPKGSDPDRATWEQHLSMLLRASSSETDLWPATTNAEQQATLDAKDLQDLSDDTLPLNEKRFLVTVQQLAQEFSLLRPAKSQTADQLVAELNKLSVKLVDGSAQAAGDYLRTASDFYFGLAADKASLPRPAKWPVVDSAAADRIYNLLWQMAGEVAASYVAPAAGGRFDDSTSVYAARAFIRLKCPRGCPPKIIWSEYSQPFQIAPWFEQGPVAPVAIILPDPNELLKTAKPGVSFVVPRSLAQLLNQPAKDLLSTPGQGGDLKLDWICGFNIPIITICAFILLNVILNLLNIVFFWLPFVKICIPFPRKK
jgi:hypothetical protein